MLRYWQRERSDHNTWKQRDNFASRSELSESFKNLQTAYAMGIADNNYKRVLHKSYLVNRAIASDYQSKCKLYKGDYVIKWFITIRWYLLSITGILDIRAVGNLILLSL